jgi:hypothetical protein
MRDDSETVSSIVAKGNIPLIVSVKLDHGQSKFEVLQWNNKVQFVAISHVWSYGRGNPKHNTFPYCQLAWLQEAVNDLSGFEDTHPVHFWIDTICVP